MSLSVTFACLLNTSSMGTPPPAQAACSNDWVIAKPKPPPEEAAALWGSGNSSAALTSVGQGTPHGDRHGTGTPDQSPACFVAASFAVDTSSHSWAKAFPLTAAPHPAASAGETEQAGCQQASLLCSLCERHLLQFLCHSVALMWKGNWVLLQNWTLWKHTLPLLSNAFLQTENLTLQ